MTKTLGCDVSFWNGAVNFVKMKSAGASFVGVKASQLTIDTQFKTYWRDAKAAGLLRFAYHYLDWRESELTQAQRFTDAMGGDWGELPPVCDFEMSYLAPEPAVANGKLWNFLQVVERTTGKIPMIYSGYYYWLYYGTPNVGWAKYPFWLAWYENESVIKVPPPWTAWKFWQYTGNGNGPQYGSTGLSMDMDYFNGTVEELKAFAGTTPPSTITLEQRVSKLEQVAREHGWSV
jgi:lysozyme